jgi:signal transduction histidine kinase
MGQLTAAVGQRLSVVAREKGIALNVDAAPMPPIAGDGDRLAQVLTNLISNAISYTPGGGSVNVRTYANNGGVEVSVQDTGVGISAKELPLIFERFYQVDKARGPKRGTGLGLAIVYEIITAHGGKVNVASDGEGKGSTFTIWLPSPYLSTVIARRRTV